MKQLKTQHTFELDGARYAYHSLAALEPEKIQCLPLSIRILLENLLRCDGNNTAAIDKLLHHAKNAEQAEISFIPARVLMQDFTGIPALVDLAAMRDVMQSWGLEPSFVNPRQPTELVIDHSIQVDDFGNPQAWARNSAQDYGRNRERYQFLRWSQKAFSNLKIVPPDTGIVHQVNLEYLARVVFKDDRDSGQAIWVYPDTLVGTDSHTTMINGLGILGWGVGGIEAEAALLGQAIDLLIPRVVGVRLTGSLAAGIMATDLVLSIVERLRKHGVVGQFVEFFGPGVASLSLADRTTIANMAPEYGATCGYFPIDERTLEYLTLTGRSVEHVRLIKHYAQLQGLFSDVEASQHIQYQETLEIALDTIRPAIAGPRRPQDRLELHQVKQNLNDELAKLAHSPGDQSLPHGATAIAAITSCTNTSNPAVMFAAGLVAKAARARGLSLGNWVKPSLAPGSKTVTQYLKNSGLLADLEALGFYVVGYGCTTCIGNSGPLSATAQTAAAQGVKLAAVLSGNRNFEGRIHPDVYYNYLASPPLVVAYALAGRMNIDLTSEPLGMDTQGQAVYLKDLWPDAKTIQAYIEQYVYPDLYRVSYQNIDEGSEAWKQLPVVPTQAFAWDKTSTYIKKPSYLEQVSLEPAPLQDISGSHMLVWLGHSITTDHISPAGNIEIDSPAGRYLRAQGVSPAEFNAYGARRGNHEVMMRGTFANIRLRNQLAQGREGSWTTHWPSGQLLSIYEAAMKYQADQIPLVVVAGKDYGSGSSRDWAAKGPKLLGIQVVIAQSFERIHRTNLVGMGILPLMFLPGESAESWGLKGNETFDFMDIEQALLSKTMTVQVRSSDGHIQTHTLQVRLDTPQEVAYYRHQGILPYTLRKLAHMQRG